MLDVGRNRVGGEATRPDAWPATITRERRYYVDAPSPEAESRANISTLIILILAIITVSIFPECSCVAAIKIIVSSSLTYVLDVFPAATLEATVRINFGFP